MRRAPPSWTVSAEPSSGSASPTAHLSGLPLASVTEEIARLSMSRTIDCASLAASRSSVAVPPSVRVAKSTSRFSDTWVTRATSGSAWVHTSFASGVVNMGAGAVAVCAARGEAPASSAAASRIIRMGRRRRRRRAKLQPAVDRGDLGEYEIDGGDCSRSGARCAPSPARPLPARDVDDSNDGFCQ